MLRTVTATMPVAVVVAVDPWGWNPFGPLRWAVVGVLVGVLLVGLGRLPAWRLPRVATLLWAAVLVAVAIAALGAADTWAAWTGTAERHFGALTWLLLVVAFVAGCQLPRTAWPGVLRGGAVAAVLVGAWALVERWWGRPVDYVSSSSRLGGPFGSAAYLGAACCLLLPLALGVALDRRTSTGWRAVGTVGAATSAVAVVGSGARAAWVGLAIAAVVTAVLAGRGAPRAVAAVLGVVAIALAVIGPSLGAVAARDGGATSRLDEWRVATRVLAAHPLAGVGPEGYRLVAAAGVDDAYEREHGREVLPDRAHSGPLDVAVTIGVPGAVAWIGLSGAVLLAAVRAVRRRRAAGVAIAAGLVAYLAQQWLLFPLAELDPLWWLLAGALVADTSAVVDRIEPRRSARVAAVGCGAVVGVVALVAGVADLAADRLARQAVDALGSPAAVDAARQAVARRPDVLRYRLLLATADEALGTRRGVDDAIVALDAAARWSPRDPVVRRRAAELLGRRAEITGDPADVAASAAAWRELLAGDPRCGPCWLAAGDVAAIAGDVAAAEAAWRRADELTERDATPATRLRDLYSLTGRDDDAARMAARAAAVGTP